LLDAVGNLIPDGSKVVVSAASCGGRDAIGFCINSAGGQILDGTASPSGSIYKFFTVQNGKVTATYADQGLAVGPGQTNTARVVLLPSDASGAILSSTALGSIPVSLAGLTSGTGSASPGVVFADGSDQRTTVTLGNFKDAAGQPVPDGTMIAASAASCFVRNAAGFCISSAGGQIVGTNPAPFFSSAQLFTIANGQVVLTYSSQGVAFGNGQQSVTVGVMAVTPQGNAISSTAVATVPIQLLAPGSSTVAVSPANVFADGADRRSQIVVSGLLDADGVTLVPDGTKLGLTAANCATRNAAGFCISSAGGAILSAGTTPGDGTPSPSNSLVDLFTVAGGQINAVYSALGLFAGVNEQKEVSVSALPASSSGNLLSSTSFGLGTIQLRGMTSATAAGPATLSLSGQTTGTITFSGIKDSAGNTVPDGANVAVTVASCASRDTNGFCNFSTGGTLNGGAASPSGSQFKVFTVTNGVVTIPYSTAGATTGTAKVQALPARSDGTVIGGTTLVGGVWAINVTN
jgi:hypothetical protein